MLKCAVLQLILFNKDTDGIVGEKRPGNTVELIHL